MRKCRVVVENESFLNCGNLGPKLWRFSRPSLEQKESKVKEGGMFWVIGVRLLVVVVFSEFLFSSNPDFERKSWKPLTTGFMIYGLFIFLKSRDWWFSTVFQETTLPRNYRAVEHFRCLIDALCPVVFNLSTKLNTLQHDSKSCCTHEVENVGCW